MTKFSKTANEKKIESQEGRRPSKPICSCQHRDWYCLLELENWQLGFSRQKKSTTEELIRPTWTPKLQKDLRDPFAVPPGHFQFISHLA